MKVKRHIKVIYQMIPIAVIVGVVIVTLSYIVNFKRFSSVFENIKGETELGNAIAGTTAPLLGILGIIATFIAFWTQYTFNRRQLNFYMQDKLDRKTDEINKILENIISRENSDNAFINTIIGRTLDNLENTTDLTDVEYVSENPIVFSFHNIFKSEFKNNSLFDGNKYDDEYIRQLSSKILALHKDVYSLLILYMIEIEKFNLSSDEQYELLVSFVNKFIMLYRHNNSSMFLFTFLYTYEMESNRPHGSHLIARYIEEVYPIGRRDFYEKYIRLNENHPNNRIVL